MLLLLHLLETLSLLQLLQLLERLFGDFGAHLAVAISADYADRFVGRSAVVLLTGLITTYR